MSALLFVLLALVSSVEAFSPAASVSRRPAIVASRPSALVMAEDLSPEEIKMKLELLEKQMEIAKMKQMLAESESAAPAEPVPVPAVEAPIAAAPVVPEPAAVAEMAPAVPEPAAFASIPEPAAVAAPSFDAVAPSFDAVAPSFDAVAPSVQAAAGAVIESGPAVETGFTATDLMNIAPAFGLAFTVFPAIVIIGSELMKPKPVGMPDAKPARAPGDKRSAEDIFTGGLENLGKDPVGWLFSKKPTPLYSNEPPPAPPMPTEPTGVVVPTAEVEEKVEETPQ